MSGNRLLGVFAIVVTLSGCATSGSERTSTEVSPTPPAVAAPALAPVPEPPRQADPVARLNSELLELQNAVAKLMLNARQHDEQLIYLQRRVAELESQTRSRAAAPVPGFAPAGPAPAALPPPPVTPPIASVPPTGSPSAAARPDPTPPSPAPPLPSSAASAAEELLQAGLTKYEAGDLDGAVVALYEVVASFPTDPARERAQYLIGDIFYTQKDYRGAVAELEGLVKAVPTGSRVPEALLKLGMAQRSLGEEAKARRTWQRLVKEHPNSQAARQARTLLRASKS